MTSTAVSRKSIVGEPLVEGGLSSQTGQVQKDNVKVVIRVRPLNERELSHGNQKQCLIIDQDGEKVVLDRGLDQKTFTFDYVADI